MLGEGGTALSKLRAAVREFQDSEDREIDLKGLRQVMDSLEGTFSADTRRAQQTGTHLADGNATVVSCRTLCCSGACCRRTLLELLCGGMGRRFRSRPGSRSEAAGWRLKAQHERLEEPVGRPVWPLALCRTGPRGAA